MGRSQEQSEINEPLITSACSNASKGDDAKNPLICIVGPTASGKSDLAEALALKLKLPIISCDAMQVYRKMDIGTAKVWAQKSCADKHISLEMVDVVDLDEDYSVQIFQRQGRACIERSRAASELKTAVICGGTGLYLDALIDDMDFVTSKETSELRQSLEELAEREGALAVHKLLQEQDPKSAALIHPNNLRRSIRALEFLQQHQSYAQRNERLKQRKPFYPALLFAFSWPRAELYARIDKRVDLMIQSGLPAEVKRLLKAGLAKSKTASQAIGYKEFITDGHLSTEPLESIASAIKQATHRYAKRQLSWLRRDGRVHYLDPGKSQDELCEQIFSTWKKACIHEP